MHFKFTDTKKRTQGKSHFTSLGSDEAWLTRITDVTEKTTQLAMFLGSSKKTKVSDEVRFDELSHWIGKVKQRRCAECGKTTLYFC